MNAGVAHRIHNIKKWLYCSATACVIGLTLIVAGYKALIFSSVFNEYSSGGVIQKSEPDTIFENNNLDSYLLTLGCNFYELNKDQNCLQKKQNITERQKLETLLLPTYQGRILYKDVDGGRRVYIHRGITPTNGSGNRWLILIGSLIFFSGLFGFFVEFRLRKI